MDTYLGILAAILGTFGVLFSIAFVVAFIRDVFEI
jgi:hypothetical protein